MSLYISGGGAGCANCPDCGADDPCASLKPTITSNLNECGNTSTAFSYTITATDSPTSFSASGLPSGLSINTGTGVISGTPTTTTSANVTIGATNACGTGIANLRIQLNAEINLTNSCGNQPSSPVTCIDDSYSGIGHFTCEQTITFTEYGSMVDWRFVVTADGSTVHDSTCIFFNPAPIVTSLTIPAGTTTLRVVGTCGCSGGPGPSQGIFYAINSP